MKGAVPLFMGCLILFSSAAFAEEEKKQEGFESYSLGEVYIKGDKPPVVKEVTVTNEITADDIEATSSHTVPEALSHTPGVVVTTGRRNEPTISMRGLDQSRVLIMVDGIPYYTTFTGKLDLNQFTTENIAKIEVTKGAASVLYGANALAGAVNIITKQASGKPYLEVTGEVGENDTYRASISHGMKKGIFSYWLNYSHDQSRGYNLSDDYVPGIVKANITSESVDPVTRVYTQKKSTKYYLTQEKGLRKQSDFDIDSFWTKFGIEPTPGSEYFLSFRYITRDKGNTVPVTSTPSMPSENVFLTRPAFTPWFRFDKYDDLAVDLSGQQQVGDKVTLKAKLYYHRHEDDLNSYYDPSFNVVAARSSYRDYSVGGNLVTEFRPVPWDAFRVFFNYIGDSHQQRDDSYLPFERFFSFTGSTGFENEITYWKNFSLVIGGSYDWFHVTDALQNQLWTFKNKAIVPDGITPGDLKAQKEGAKPQTMNAFNPMIGANYTFADTTRLFASVARKTRFPTLSNLYSSKGGNVNLQAENAINSTVGVSRSFGKYAWGELAFYYNSITDMIGRNSSDKTAPMVNFGQVEIYGVELNSEFYPAKDLTLRVGYTFTNANNQSEGVDLIPYAHLVTYVPEHKLDLGAQYTIPVIGVRVDLNGTYVSEMFSQVPSIDRPKQALDSVGGHFVVDVRLSKTFLKNYEAYFAVQNLTDKYYAWDSSQFPAPGRTIFGGLKARF
jgi:outer membrane receptor protein involved in Fe transport